MFKQNDNQSCLPHMTLSIDALFECLWCEFHDILDLYWYMYIYIYFVMIYQYFLHYKNLWTKWNLISSRKKFRAVYLLHECRTSNFFAHSIISIITLRICKPSIMKEWWNVCLRLNIKTSHVLNPCKDILI